MTDSIGTMERVSGVVNVLRHILSNVAAQLMLFVRLKEFAKMYDIIKNERNKCVSLIQISTQKAAEMREKIKILDNEMEILRTTVAQKDR